MSTTLYRMYDGASVLLYVGISVQPITRIRNHEGIQPWAEEIVHVTFERFEDDEEAAIAEEVAIRVEKPVHNLGATRSEIQRRAHARKRHQRAAHSEGEDCGVASCIACFPTRRAS